MAERMPEGHLDQDLQFSALFVWRVTSDVLAARDTRTQSVGMWTTLCVAHRDTIRSHCGFYSAPLRIRWMKRIRELNASSPSCADWPSGGTSTRSGSVFMLAGRRMDRSSYDAWISFSACPMHFYIPIFVCGTRFLCQSDRKRMTDSTENSSKVVLALRRFTFLTYGKPSMVKNLFFFDTSRLSIECAGL